MDNSAIRKLLDNYIRNCSYSDLEDVQNRIDYYVARNVITAEEAYEYQRIASERVEKTVVSPKEAAYIARIEKLENDVVELQAQLNARALTLHTSM